MLFFVYTHSASALTLSPVKVDVTGDPGQTLIVEMELVNDLNETKTYYSSYENFEPADDTGSPKFVGATDGLATWMHTDESVTLGPKEQKLLSFTITIPADAEPGGYFSAIFWGEQPPNKGDNQVAIGGKLGLLILLRVDGDIPEGVGLAEFGAQGGRFYSMLPISFSYRLNNIGADRIVPLGEVTVRNTWGGVAGTLNANTMEGSVLPNSTRRFSVTWQDMAEAPSREFFAAAMSQLKNPRIGLYRADLHVAWGERNQTSDASYRFFIFPWQLAITVMVLGAFLYVLLRQYNRWIISRANNQSS